MGFSYKTRPQLASNLESQIWDVFVIGGGATGAAVARDAALRGLKVALIEAKDFASATSSGSTKLFHGGIRYLENFEFKLVFEAIRERENLTKLYAPFVQPLSFVFPTYEDSIPPLWKLNIGLHLYDSFSFFHQRHRKFNKSAAREEFPLLKSENLTGACVYTDSFAEDYRIVIELIKSAHRSGAVCLSQMKAAGIKKNHDGIFEIDLRDEWSSQPPLKARARAVFNCSGPFSDQVRSLLGKPPTLKLTQGVHIIIKREDLPIDRAYVFSDKVLYRILFAIPWKSVTYLGTTDTSVSTVEEAKASKADVDYILGITNQFFKSQLNKEQVMQSWAAVRPLIRPSQAADNSQISREHQIEEGPENYFDILGGKLTSHRLMAEEAIRFLERKRRLSRTKTHAHPLQDHLEVEPGDPLEKKIFLRYGRFYKEVLRLDQELGLSRKALRSHPDYLVSEVVYSIREEMCLDPIDFIRRRSSLYYETQWKTEAQEKLVQEISEIFLKEIGDSSKTIEFFTRQSELNYRWDSEGFRS